MTESRKPSVLRYGCAFVSVAVAILLRRMLDPLLGAQFPFALVLFAVMLTAWFGGLWPALTGVCFGGLAADYFLLDPRGRFALEKDGLPGLLFYLALGAGIALIGGLMHRARDRAEISAAALRMANEQLEARVQERSAELLQRTGKLEAEIAEGRRTKKALSASELRYRRLFETAKEGILILDAETGMVVDVNPFLITLLGFSHTQFLGKAIWELGFFKDVVANESIFAELREKEYIRYENLPLETHDGKRIEVEFISSVYLVNDAKVIQCNVRDLTARRLAEVASARLAAIVESTDDAVVGKDLAGMITSWNGGAEKIFGYSAQEMVGQSILRLIPPERHQEETEILAHVRRGESIRHFDTVRLHKNGNRLDISVTVSPIRDATGRIIGASKVARDVTKRKRAEEALQQREAEFRTLTNAMPQIVWATRPDGGNIYFNQRWTDYTGLTLAESLGDGWNKPFHPEDQQRAQDAWQKAVAGQGDYSLECRLRRADGVYHWWWILGAPLRAANGSILKWFGTCTDITERKQAEAALRDSEERFRTMANSMSQLAWIAQADGAIAWYNQRWYEYTGTTPEQMTGWGWQSVHDPSRLAQVLAQWQSAIDGGQPFEMEFPLRGADGQFRRFLTRGQPLKDSDGRVVQWFGTNTDVETLKRTEGKVLLLNSELEQRVRERTGQLEAANKELEAFSYSVSHDLRAPLRAVNGFTGLVLAEFGEQLPATGKHYLERIQKGGLRMGVLIDDLLAFSRLSRQPVKSERVDVVKLVKSALEELKPQREGREIELRVGNLPTCQGDFALLKQVWINLLSNAVKYTQGRTPATIEIGCSQENGEQVYFVRDNGAGFEMQYAHKLFGVFQRLHRADEFEGTGVGLAIVQRIVHGHGGRVWAQAELNRGATFYFTLAGAKQL